MLVISCSTSDRGAAGGNDSMPRTTWGIELAAGSWSGARSFGLRFVLSTGYLLWACPGPCKRRRGTCCRQAILCRAAIHGQYGQLWPEPACFHDSATPSGQNWPMTSADEEPFLTEPEAAEIIRVSPRTLRRWRVAGTGPPVAGFAGRRALYRRSELLAWIRRKREGG